MLEKYHDEMLSCTGCAFCKKSYAAYAFPQKESDYPKGKIMLAYGLYTGELKENMELVKALQKCTLCKRCEKDCPSLIKITDIIKAARYDLTTLLPEHETLFENFRNSGNILGEKNFERDGGRIAFFMGCIVNKEMKDVIISLFDKLGVDVSIIGGCCGNPLEKIGRKVETDVGKKLREKGIEKVVLSCPNGILSLKEFNPVHITQFILSLNPELKREESRYIYHDSSFLGRYLGIYDEPREIISRVGNLVEFNENREMARQCGGEIEFRKAFPAEAEEMAKYLIKEAEEKNATIVTASPHCYSHLKEYGEVKDIIHLLEESII